MMISGLGKAWHGDRSVTILSTYLLHPSAQALSIDGINVSIRHTM